MTKFKRKRMVIQELDSIGFVGLKYIDCGKALQNIIENNEEHTYSCTSLIQYLIILLHKNIYCIVKRGMGKNVFLFLENNYDRPHVYRKLQNVADLLEDCIEIRFTGKKRLNFVKILLGPIMLIWIIQMYNTSLHFSEKCYFAMCLFHGMQELDQVRKQIGKEKIYTVTSIHDVRYEDSMIVQYYNHKKVNTVQVIHTQYSLPEDEFDYCCSTSKFFLSYNSKMTEDAINLGIEKDRIFEVGNPAFINITVENESFSEEKFICVFLSYPTYGRMNNELIRMARSLSNLTRKRYLVKTHPIEDKNKYCDLNEDYLFGGWIEDKTNFDMIKGKADIALVAYSNVYTDLIYHDIPTLRFANKEKYYNNRYPYICDFTFKDEQELYEQYKVIHNTNYSEVQMNIKSKLGIEKHQSEIKQLYKEAYHSIMNK